MYLPEHFTEERSDVMQHLIAQYPLGTLVTLSSNGLTADQIPFLFEPCDPNGRLIGHVARKNDLWHDRVEGVEALVVFQGVSAYISPNWYVTKHTTHEVVPTYNYVVVQVHGSVIVHEDAKWLRGAVGKLTRAMEANQHASWKMADAPSPYIAAQLQNIVGIEIPITSMTGKWKTSQNRPIEDRLGAIAGLRASGAPEHAAMADLIERTIEPSI